MLDLGRVGLIADVYVNGKSLGILWKPPYRVNIAPVARAGANHLEIEVANVWNNRLVGDSFRPEGLRYTNTNIVSPLSWRPPWKEAALIESGLMGPVTVRAAKRITVKLQ